MTLEELERKAKEEREYAAQLWIKPRQKQEAYRRYREFRARAESLKARGKTEE